MREEAVVKTIRACKAAGRKDLVSALRSGVLTAANVQQELAGNGSPRLPRTFGCDKHQTGQELREA